MAMISRGYRAIPSEAIEITTWTVSIPEIATYTKKTRLEDWSRFQRTNVTVKLTADVDESLEALGLSAAADLRALCTWSCPRTGRRGLSPHVPFGAEMIVTFSIAEGEIAGDLKIDPEIILASTPEPGSPGSPSEPGAIVWQAKEPVRILLEGVAPRMPVIAAPCSAPPFSGRNSARWHVEIDSSDLDAPIEAALLVLLNDGNRDVAKLLGDPASDAATCVLRFLQLDINRVLVQTAISEGTELDPAGHFPDGSIGSLLVTCATRLDDDIESLRSLAIVDPAGFDTDVQAAFAESVVPK